MGMRIVAIVMILAGMGWAQDASPATQPAAPASQPSAARLPTPAELMEQMKQRREATARLTKVAHFDLNGTVTEKEGGLSLFSSGSGDTLYDIVKRLEKARDDKSVSAVLITIGADMSMSLAHSQEIRDTLLSIRRSGKKTFIYADSYDTISYSLASGGTNVCLPEGGEIMIPGVGMETTFYKGTLDKLGVTADYVQIGEYKGAEEPYTRTAASEELKAEMTKLTAALFEQIIDGISLSRNLSTQSVRMMVDDAMMTARVAKDRGFVDHLVEQDDLRTLLKDELGNEVSLLSKYGEDERQELDLSNPLLLLAALNRKPAPATRPAVAVVYAEGVINDGGSGTSLLGDEVIGSDSMRKTLRIAARDPNVKVIVLRIDSPGGSALASEVIWQALRKVSEESKKPVIVSIGSMAASGGYYLASAGDYIFADRAAIIGSIGVVGGKFVFKDLYEKIGLTTETFVQGRNADLFSSSNPFNDRQRRMIRTWMQQTYDQFTQRIMTTRKDKIKDIDKVARGRVFLAPQARELGMIDELGGTSDAIAYAAKKAGLAEGKYDVQFLPAPRSLLEMLTGEDAEAAIPFRPQIEVKLDPTLLALPAPIRKMLGRQLQMIQLMEKRPVVLMTPFVVNFR